MAGRFAPFYAGPTNVFAGAATAEKTEDINLMVVRYGEQG